LAEGTIVNELSPGSGISGNITGVVKVDGSNGVDAPNAAMVFDSSCPPTFTPADCSGADDDLGTPNEAFSFKPQPGPAIPGPGVGVGGFPSNNSSEGNILILTEDFDSSDPDDADNLGMFVDFDFGMVDGSVTVNSITIMDVEAEQGEAGTFVEFFTSGSSVPTDLVAIPPTGDNGVVEIKNIKLDNVDRMTVNFNGSGAMLSAVFGAKEAGVCWTTTGGFQNAGFQAGMKDFTFGGNVGPPPSGVWEVVEHTSGDNFHSNDVEVIECNVLDDGFSGPEQPGGKKGFEENRLLFKGTGRLREAATGVVTDGLPFRGCVIDAGEPAGKQGLDTDFFEIVVCTSGTCEFTSGLCTAQTAADLPPDPQAVCDGLADPVFAACAALDGGNVQIHPPTGKP
ncbi:MAG: hypothetical protein ACE5GS_12000, partial [Kiloniellaceae bacterium]